MAKVLWPSTLCLVLLFCSNVVWAMDYAAVYTKSASAVVYISVFLDESEGQSGSGFIVGEDGLVLTNHHVIYEEKSGRKAGRILVFLKPDKVTGRSRDDLLRQFDAVVVAQDKELDLALLKIRQVPSKLRPLQFASSGSASVGDPTAAIGHPVGGVRWSLTTGRISGELADLEGIKDRNGWQMETALNPGNSGGPLLDEEGRVLGVNSVVVRKAADGTPIEGINFALKSEVALEWLAKVSSASGKKKPVKFAASDEQAPAIANSKPPRNRKPPKKTAAKAGTVYAPDDISAMIKSMEEKAKSMEADFERQMKRIR